MAGGETSLAPGRYAFSTSPCQHPSSRSAVATRPRHRPISVIPAKAGIHHHRSMRFRCRLRRSRWTPACEAVKNLARICLARPSRLGRQATEHLRMRRWSASMPVANRCSASGRRDLLILRCERLARASKDPQRTVQRISFTASCAGVTETLVPAATAAGITQFVAPTIRPGHNLPAYPRCPSRPYTPPRPFLPRGGVSDPAPVAAGGDRRPRRRNPCREQSRHGPAAVPGCRPENPPALRPAVRVAHLKGVGPVPTGKPPGDRIGPGRDGGGGWFLARDPRPSGVRRAERMATSRRAGALAAPFFRSSPRGPHG